MRLVLLVSTMTAVAVAAGLAVAQPKKPDGKGAAPAAAAGSAAKPPTPTPGAGSGSAAPTGTGAGSGATTGAGSGTEAGSGEEPPPSDEPEVDSLRQEYLKLRDELFESRARAATVASQLYSTKISLRLTYTSGRMYGISRATIRLDGAGVYDNTTGAIATDDGIRFEGYIAPGRHVLTFRVEANGKDDARFTTSVESTVVIQAVAGKDLLVAGRAKDGGDMAYAWKKKEQGTYKLGLDIDVKSFKRPTEKKASAASKGSAGATASR